MRGIIRGQVMPEEVGCVEYLQELEGWLVFWGCRWSKLLRQPPLSPFVKRQSLLACYVSEFFRLGQVGILQILTSLVVICTAAGRSRSIRLCGGCGGRGRAGRQLGLGAEAAEDPVVVFSQSGRVWVSILVVPLLVVIVLLSPLLENGTGGLILEASSPLHGPL